MGLKLSAFTPSLANLAAGNKLIGVVGANDFGFTAEQVAYFMRNPIVVDKGNQSAGTQTFDVSQGPKHKLQLSGNLTIAFSNWPASGTYGEIEIRLINAGTHITWPTINWALGNGGFSTTFTDMGVTFLNAGSNFALIWSDDGGATLYGSAI
jgi:hypothetical protein